MESFSVSDGNAASRASSLLQCLLRDAATLGVVVTEEDGLRLCVLLDELARWNKAYNLTAIRTCEQMLTHHLLDSLAIHADVTGERIADAGTGAGFPGLPLAIIQPARRFTLIDSNGKKIRFVTHVCRLLGLDNVEVVQARIETLAPAAPFDTVVARALAPLPKLVNQVAPLAGPATRVLAMKGRDAAAEIARLPRTWRVVAQRALIVPGLLESRCLVTLAREASGG